jgi:murein DD-endopeptidase MepM/ murein hydrolase activator NlpD
VVVGSPGSTVASVVSGEGDVVGVGTVVVVVVVVSSGSAPLSQAPKTSAAVKMSMVDRRIEKPPRCLEDERSPIRESSGVAQRGDTGRLPHVGGKRLPQFMLTLVVLVALVPIAAAPPAVAERDGMCEPFTRSDLGPPAAEQATTTTTAVDLIDQSRARDSEPSVDTPGDEPSSEEPPTTRRPPTNCSPFVYQMEYPLLGAGWYASGFGAPRGGGTRLHMGVDLMAPKMTPVVAVADGFVSRIKEDSSGTAGVYVAISHEDGWSSWYIHLNNDTFGTDDGLGIGVRPDLEVGARVQAGELIGWVGDSGNAETTPPHLHFELHLPSGEPIDPYASIVSAEAVGASAFAVDPIEILSSPQGEANSVDLISARLVQGGLRPDFVGPFIDDDGLVAERAFGMLTALGVPAWCDDWGVRVCPDDPITGGDAEAWIEAAAGSDRDASVAISYESTQLDPGLDRSTVVACGMTTLCADEPVSFGEAAAMIIGATDGVSVLSPADATGTLAKIGLAGCGGPQNPDRPVTRVELAELLLRALGHEPIAPCGTVN